MLQIVVPMAGRGERFRMAGYDLPKPMIPVYGMPMIQVVINNLRPSCDHRFIFICQKAHLERHPLDSLLHDVAPGSEIISTAGVTAGAACTTLLAREYIATNQPLMIANCDQWINFPIDDYLAAFDRQKTSGFIMTMKSSDPKWSYVERDDAGRVAKVVEKQVVSHEATVGIYNFSRGIDFVHAAEAMIAADDRTMGEFYVAPTYSRLIQSGGIVDCKCIGIDRYGMFGLGTPADLDWFLSQSAIRERVTCHFASRRNAA